MPDREAAPRSTAPSAPRSCRWRDGSARPAGRRPRPRAAAALRPPRPAAAGRRGRARRAPPRPRRCVAPRGCRLRIRATPRREQRPKGVSSPPDGSSRPAGPPGRLPAGRVVRVSEGDAAEGPWRVAARPAGSCCDARTARRSVLPADQPWIAHAAITPLDETTGGPKRIRGGFNRTVRPGRASSEAAPRRLHAPRRGSWRDSGRRAAARSGPRRTGSGRS